MKIDESLLRQRNQRNTLIRRELYLMLTAGILISLIIAWCTAGITVYPFYIRLTFSVICIVILNLIAYFMKLMK